MRADHQKPLAAFVLVSALACLIMGNGLRTQVGNVLIGAGAPPVPISAVASDLILGQSLDNVRQAPRATPDSPSPESSRRSGIEGPDESDDSAGSGIVSRSLTVAGPATQPNQPTTRPRAGSTQSNPEAAAGAAAGPVAPGDVVTPQPVPATAPSPEPAPVTSQRPSLAPTSPQSSNRSSRPPDNPAVDSGDRRTSRNTGRNKDRADDSGRDQGKSDRGKSEPGRDRNDGNDRGRGSEPNRSSGAAAGDSRQPTSPDRTDDRGRDSRHDDGDTNDGDTNDGDSSDRDRGASGHGR